MSKKQILDHGYLEFVESWGSDERIVEAARMSTGKGFLGWEPGVCPICSGARTQTISTLLWDEEPELEFIRNGHMVLRGGVSHEELVPVSCFGCEGKGTIPGDKNLLKRLWMLKHATPFEMGGLVVEVQAPIMVYREWHRHRTQCLAPETMIHFDAPKRAKSGNYGISKMSIEDLWRKWQPTVRAKRQNRQKNAFYPRSLVQSMFLRNVNEDSSEVEHSHIVDVVRGEMKPMVTVTTVSGRKLTATEEHKVLTQDGWMKLGEAINRHISLAMEGKKRGKAQRWEVPLPGNDERWVTIPKTNGAFEVSDYGRVKAVFGYSTQRTTVMPGQILTVREDATGYNYVVLRLGKVTSAMTVHTLVLEAFVGPKPSGQEARHLNSNKADARLSNLAWGTSAENKLDMLADDRHQRLTVQYEEIVLVEDIGEKRSYDITVEGPWHNFIADGFVVHNSYNEMSARYTPLPDLNYVPSVERLLVNSKTNKQAGVIKGADELTEEGAETYRQSLMAMWWLQQKLYETALKMGVPKELARIHLGVGRYSRMRASANLRNWLGFLTLRMDAGAQWEIQRYAHAIGELVAERFPRIWSLFIGD